MGHRVSLTRALLPTVIIILLPGLLTPVRAQDSSYKHNNNVITLKEVVVRSNVNVPAFIERIQKDTSFYKAFKNLRILGYEALNDVRMLDRDGGVRSSLQSRTVQYVDNGCRWMNIIEQKHSPNYYDKEGKPNTYTAQMYAGLFFTEDTVCGETNVVGTNEFSLKGKSGLSKHKEQLKMLFFNPGKRIPGIPFIGNKIALFSEDVAELYDFVIDMETLKGELCYVFRQTPRTNLTAAEKNRIVINEMITWFSQEKWDIVARQYDLSYKAAVYDFDVRIEVELTRFEDLMVPVSLRYNGNWDVPFKPRERGVFTATLFRFTK